MPESRNFFQRIPFVRIASLFLAGVLIRHSFLPDGRLIAAVLVGFVSFLILLWHNGNFTSVRVQNMLLAASVLLAGVFYPNFPGRIDGRDFGQKDYYLAEVCQKPGEKARTFQTVLRIQNEKLTEPEKVVAYLSKEGFDSTITTGDQLIILAKPQKIKNQGNPFEFDYRLMMQRRNIWFSVYLEKGTYLKTHRQTFYLGNWAEKVRDRLVEKLALVLTNKEERAVVSALTLGYCTELDQDTLDYFASTGAMHVLSVSGLHVALIFKILGFLLGFLKRGKAGAVVFPVVMVSFLWFYAFISGFSPPVQRATVMFTFVIAGNCIRRPVNIYNSLTASALFLLLLDPNVIFDVGFQLSYLAIFGIVLIQPEFFQVIELKNPALKVTWALFTVGVAAQLATFPLGVFYFNQFPNFFWLSNFVVVPATTAIMWASMAFFALVPFQELAMFAGLLIEKLTFFMLEILKAIDAHPLAVTKGIVATAGQVWVIYGIISAFLIFWFSKRKQWLFCGLFLIIVLQCAVLRENTRLLNQKLILVYNSKSTLIHLINGRTNYLVVNGANIQETDEKMIRKVVDHLKLDAPLLLDKNKTCKHSSDDLMIRGDSILFLNSCIRIEKGAGRANNDYLSISVHPNEGGSRAENVYVSTGYPNSAKGDFPVSFCTKTDGAYFLSLDEYHPAKKAVELTALKQN